MNKLIAYAVMVLVVVLGTTACEKKDAETAAVALAPAFTEVLTGFINDPDFRAKLGKEGAPLADLAVAYMLPRIQNEITKLGTGDSVERLAYKRIQRADPDLALMIYRLDGGIACGLWPRLEAWLKVKGYLPTTLHDEIMAGRWVRLSEPDKDELIDIAGIAIAEEYRAVKLLKRLEIKAEE
jgi:hypothetical protein